MWFRNLLLYRLAEPFELTSEQLHERLLGQAFRPCSGLQAQSLGWEAPLGRDAELLTHAANGRVLVCARREERLLPAAVVREALEEKVGEIEANEGRSLRRKEKLQLKDEIVTDLLPRTFTRSSRLHAYIDPVDGWVVVDTPTPRRGEELLSLLRESIGSLRAVPLQVEQAPAAVLTGWLARGAPADFELQDECELREPLENGGIVRCRRQVLDSDEVATHLEAGKQAVRLAVTWQDRLGCLLCDDLVVRRLRFLDLVQEEAEAVAAEDAAARFDADFALMTLELQRFLPRLVEAFGGFAET